MVAVATPTHKGCRVDVLRFELRCIKTDIIHAYARRFFHAMLRLSATYAIVRPYTAILPGPPRGQGSRGKCPGAPGG